MSKKTMGIRIRKTSEGVIELWLGTPDDAESDCIFQAHEYYLPGVIYVLQNAYKAPIVKSHLYRCIRK